jgi:Zn-dependent protease
MREPLGTVIMPLVSFLMGGWMMGWASTPFDPEWARRHPRRQAVMSLAGPLGNLSVAVTAFAVIKALLLSGALTIPDRPGFSSIVAPAGEAAGGSPMAALALLLSVALNLNVLLGLFNLIPLPPLDGAGLVEGLFPRQADPLMRALRAYPALALIGLVAAWKIFGYVAGPALTFVFQLVLGSPVHG